MSTLSPAATSPASKKIYIVVFYTDYRKENEWQIHKVFSDLKEATEYVNKWTVPDSKQHKRFRVDRDVVPSSENQRILLTQAVCTDDEVDEGDFRKPEDYAEYDKRRSLGEALWKNMSWSPRVALVEKSIDE